jgi:hypothetical protein
MVRISFPATPGPALPSPQGLSAEGRQNKQRKKNASALRKGEILRKPNGGGVADWGGAICDATEAAGLDHAKAVQIIVRFQARTAPKT